jgi:hypothetical protein
MADAPRLADMIDKVRTQRAAINLGLAVDLVFVDCLPALKGGIFMRGLVRP